MTVLLSDLLTTSNTNTAPPHPRKRPRPSLTPLNTQGDGIRISCVATELHDQYSCPNLGIAKTLKESKEALTSLLALPMQDTTVFKCTGFRESKQALIILTALSGNIIVPNSGVDSFDYSTPIGATVEVHGLQFLSQNFFLALRCRIVP